MIVKLECPYKNMAKLSFFKRFGEPILPLARDVILRIFGDLIFPNSVPCANARAFETPHFFHNTRAVMRSSLAKRGSSVGQLCGTPCQFLR